MFPESIQPNFGVIGNKFVDFQSILDLEVASKQSIKFRSRICLHDTNESVIQEMLLFLERKTVIDIHKHLDRDETYILIHGEIELNLYTESKELTKTINLTPFSEQGVFIFKTLKNQWHSLRVLSETAILFEITSGPFIKKNTIGI